MEATAPRRRGAIACLMGMLAGALMLAAGLGWSAFASPAMVWSPEQAVEHQEAGEALHAARRAAAASVTGISDSATEESPELAAAQARFDEIDTQLAAAQTRRQRTGVWLVRLGLGAMIVCGVGYLSLRGE
jgi:hypothetical protein